MDKILEKHLANALVLVKSDLNISIQDQNIISYESCEINNNSCKLITELDSITSEVIGYWKDKPIITYNNTKYVIMENSNTIIKLKSLNITDDKIQKSSESPKNIIPLFPNKNLIKKTKSKIEPVAKEVANTVEDPITVKQEIPIPSPEKVASDLNELLPKKETSTNSVISHYIDKLKQSDQVKEEPKKDTESTVNYIQSDKPKNIEDELFSLFDNKKDDPRFKRFFNHYSDQTKKEVHEINEKYAKQYMAKILETSGGGGTSNSAVDYSNGGNINGDLTITSNLSVTGSIFGNIQIDNKRVFNIGNSTDSSYTLDHNFNTKDLIISIYDSNDEIVLASAKNINMNQTLISFSSPPIENIKVVIMR